LLSPVRKFFNLDPGRKRLFIQAFFHLGFIRLSLRSRPFKALVAGLELHRGAALRTPSKPSAQKTARLVGWAIRTAAKFTPWNSTCLVQVLAAQKMLKKRNIPGVFYIGAASGVPEGERPTLMAHAWLKCSDEFITGEPGHQQYTVISSFSW
jgi:hypothetical protein